MNPYWSYILTAVGVTGMYFVGKKRWWAWWIGVSAQFIWLAYGIVTKQWGFIFSAFAYGFVQYKNAIQWTRARRQGEVPYSVSYPHPVMCVCGHDRRHHTTIYATSASTSNRLACGFCSCNSFIEIVED